MKLDRDRREPPRPDRRVGPKGPDRVRRLDRDRTLDRRRRSHRGR
jgi:hypothetical protein